MGELSEPVRSEFGVHLIRVEDIRESRTRTFDEARDELEREFRDEQAEQIYFEQVERLANLVFEQPDNLDDAAELLGLTIEESGYVSRRGQPGHEVLGDPAVMAAAFNEEVLAGNNSEPVEIDGYRTVVLRVEERRAARQLALDEVRTEIVTTLQAEQASEDARALGVELLGRLRAGEGRNEVAGGSPGVRSALSGARTRTWDASSARCCSACRIPWGERPYSTVSRWRAATSWCSGSTGSTRATGVGGAGGVSPPALPAARHRCRAFIRRGATRACRDPIHEDRIATDDDLYGR